MSSMQGTGVIQFGMPTLLSLDSLEANAALCRSIGLSFVEISMNLPQYAVGTLDAKHLIALKREYGIDFTIHLEERFDPCDFNGAIARAYSETAMEALHMAISAEIPLINFHLNEGIYFTLPRERVYLYDRYLPRYLESLSAFREACSRANRSGIAFCVENTRWQGRSFMEQGVDCLLQSTDFGLTFDVGHNHTMGGGDETFILARKSMLRHMHLHDAMEKSNHLGLGTGEMDLEKYLRLASECGCRVVVETKTVEALAQSVDWLKTNY